MQNFLTKFQVRGETESFESTQARISAGVEFRGVNLWVLIFAIFVASLGLNVNSTAVIIGAMLISPLMGPIMGIGMGFAVNDLALLRRATINLGFAAFVGLLTSTVYFLVSPLNDAHSEILSRTAPSIYDVLIALFAGFAGIIATTSKQKGNVIPGVAIATALMPPLCTAGYGLATWNLPFFFGAMYLFIINSVFIAVATFITARTLGFPFRHLKGANAPKPWIIWVIAVLTAVPSIYVGYTLVQDDRFLKEANHFIETEANFPNDYLLKKDVDAKERNIVLTYGGKQIEDSAIIAVRKRLSAFGMSDVKLEIHQGFAYLTDKREPDRMSSYNAALAAKEVEIDSLRQRLDSASVIRRLESKLFAEIHVQHTDLLSIALVDRNATIDTSQAVTAGPVVIVGFKKSPSKQDLLQLEAWLRVRLSIPDLQLVVRS